MPNFSHLHVHSEYSLLDGSAKIKEIISRTKELGMDSIAITDHGVMFGAVDFYKAATDAGIKPILGCEVYVASGSRLNKDGRVDNFYYHLVLLAETDEGYHNLLKLVSRGFTEGYYYRPRVDLELLREYHEGIIALSACLAGPVARNVLKVSYERAKEEALLYREIFGEGNFFLELQDHGIPEQKTVNEALVRMHEETGIPLVCTNDIHYVNKEDSAAHEVLLCIQTGKTMDDDDRMMYEPEQFYLRSPEEMLALFPEHPEALENTAAIAARCNVTMTFHDYKLPRYEPPNGQTPFEFLKALCEDGLRTRYDDITDDIAARLDYELSVIRDMGFVDYFLITWDFVKFAHDNNIPVGPGRGSGAGSIVGYSLRITNVDPIRYSLIFERFLNPERVSMPDFDIDFCFERRQEVIDYVVRKYGADHVAQIITFGTMGAKGVVRDVGRALGMAYGEVDRIAKMIPFALKMTLDLAMEMNAELRSLYEADESVRHLIDMAKRLEGLPRHSSTHAAGVVVCDAPVDDYVPLSTNDGVVTTQFPMTTVEELGLLKIDFLGLRTLTVIQKTADEVKRSRGIALDMDRQDMTDPKVFEMIAQGKTEGVFQLESTGMTSFMKELNPESIEDLTAGISLYRPGPMDFIPKYIRGKNTTGAIQYTHPALEPILQATYGCIVYQEQVMQIVRDLAGYTLGRSDLVRRAMSKKKADVMEKERQNFVFGLPEENLPGCVANGIPQAAAEKIFDDMTDFAKYAFNKSHAACYAVLGYQTAFLKLYYPTEFMAALMTSVIDQTPKVAEYIGVCKKMGIAVQPPDINEGFGAFSVSGSDIRFGLNAIKNVGHATVAAIVAEREENGVFVSLTEFINRMDGREINKRCVESLIKAGSFDSLGGARNQYAVLAGKIMDGVAQNRKKNIEGQMNLFEIAVTADDAINEMFKDELPKMPPVVQSQLLAEEKEVLGIYVSGHPVSAYEEAMKPLVTHYSTAFATASEDEAEGTGSAELAQAANANALRDGENVTIGGIIAGKSVKYTKNNEAMAFVSVEDYYGAVEVILFSNTYAPVSGQLAEGQAIIVSGRASVREDRATSVVCNDIRFLYQADGENVAPETLWLKIPEGRKVSYNDVMDVLSRFRGTSPVVIYDEKTKQKMRVKPNYYINLHSEQALMMLKQLLGAESVVVK